MAIRRSYLKQQNGIDHKHSGQEKRRVDDKLRDRLPNILFKVEVLQLVLLLLLVLLQLVLLVLLVYTQLVLLLLLVILLLLVLLLLCRRYRL